MKRAVFLSTMLLTKNCMVFCDMIELISPYDCNFKNETWTY